MRIARLMTEAGPRWAALEDGTAHLLDKAPFFGGRRVGTHVVFRQEALLTPVAPSKIVCVGRNYVAHANELNNPVPTEPLLFLKPPSALVPPNGLVHLPRQSARVDFEGEIGLVIGKRCSRIRREDAREYIFGVTCCNDVTARDLQRQDKTFTRGKGFDTFAPVGPHIETDFELDALEVITRVNKEERQRGRVEEMLFSPDLLLAYISDIMTLEPGDLVMTGTPSGVGPLVDRDQVEIEITGIGVLRHGVAGKRGEGE